MGMSLLDSDAGFEPSLNFLVDFMKEEKGGGDIYCRPVPGGQSVDRSQSFPDSRQSQRQSVLQPVVRVLARLIHISVRMLKYTYKGV